jgi:sterol desaturase/sphingolipid hydroxylase (fatty acid hydroxylase superfamily)
VDVTEVVGLALFVSATIGLPLWLFARLVMDPKRRRRARRDFPRVSAWTWQYFGSNGVLLILLVMFVTGGALVFAAYDAG